jgi:hypothetical protein
MNILTLTEMMSAEELGKLILGERDALIREEAQTPVDILMESEIVDFFVDASTGHIRPRDTSFASSMRRGRSAGTPTHPETGQRPKANSPFSNQNGRRPIRPWSGS